MPQVRNRYAAAAFTSTAPASARLAKLARLPAAERRQILEDFITEVFGWAGTNPR